MTPEAAPPRGNKEAILIHLKEIVRDRLNMTPEQILAIDRDAPLLETLRLDSLGQVVLVTAVEEDFGCVFEPEEWQKLQTVNDLVNMIAERREPERPA
jgi:acyl carrier protein